MWGESHPHFRRRTSPKHLLAGVREKIRQTVCNLPAVPRVSPSMKTKTRSRNITLKVTAALFAAALLPLAGLSAQEEAPAPKVGPLLEGRPAIRAAMNAFHNADISKAQREQIRKVLQKYYPDVNPLVDKVITERKLQREVVRTTPVDETAVRKQSAAVAAVEADLAVQLAYISSEIQAILRPEQIKELRALESILQPLFEQKRERFGRWLMSDS